MKIFRAEHESGFTLVELLVACAILMVLGALSVQAYSIYKQNAYHKVALQMMGQARLALEAGKVDSETFPQHMMIVDRQAPGPAVGGDADLLVPGLVLPSDFYVRVQHDPTCSVPGCIQDSIVSRHCKINKKVWFVRAYKMGELLIEEAAAGGAC